MLMSRLKCSFLAAPMFPIASVKEEIMTRIPEMELNHRVGVERKKKTWERRGLLWNENAMESPGDSSLGKTCKHASLNVTLHLNKVTLIKCFPLADGIS